MKGFIKRGAVIVTAGMLLAGCGEPLKALTEGEETIVVNYAAGTLTKFNNRQPDGITVVPPKEEQQEPEETKEPEKTPEDTDKKAEDNQEDKDQGSQSQEQEPKGMTLTDAMGISGIEFTYQDYSVSDNYEQSDYFSMAAPEGKTYIVLNVAVANTTNQDAECNVMDKKPIFTLKVNDSKAVKNQVTILPNDLSTFEETVKAGSTVQTVLIFEVPEEEAENISSFQAGVQIDGASKGVELK